MRAGVPLPPERVADRESSLVVRRSLRLEGVVQGVGLRPSVYELACRYGLFGTIRNRHDAVEVILEGNATACDAFERELLRLGPPVVVERVEQRGQRPLGLQCFEIAPSVVRNRPDTAQVETRAAVLGCASGQVAPDLAICDACLRELRDPANRRYRYPFISCAHCGPRYTILEALPYDRERTSMRAFPLCAACSDEYADPRARRFHAETLACAECGPSLRFVPAGQSAEGQNAADQDAGGPDAARQDGTGQGVRARHARHAGAQAASGRVATGRGEGRQGDPGWSRAASLHSSEGVLRAAVELVRDGGILALQGIGGFQLLVRASDRAAVARLRRRKLRPHKPFALLCRDLASVEDLCTVSAPEAELLASPAAPIVLLRRRRPPGYAGQGSAGQGSAGQSAPALELAEEVAPDSLHYGVMLPASGLHALLADELAEPIVATSGNRSGEPLCIDPEEARERLAGVADAFLVHDRPILRPCDDSVARITLGGVRLLRRARGYAPSMFRLPRRVEAPVLALGGHMKSTIALAQGARCWLGPYIGDLEHALTCDTFDLALRELGSSGSDGSARIAHDVHPDYWTTRRARELDTTGTRASPVWHHFAHVYALCAEHGIDPSPHAPVLGVAWDGAGLGPDGQLWGGEFLICDGHQDHRVATLRSFPLPGATRAMREPRRSALGLLYAGLGETSLREWVRGCSAPMSTPTQPCGPHGAGWELPSLAAFAHAERKLVLEALARGVNAPLTSSVGRLFDAMASLLDLCQLATYEGQAAIRLEACAEGACSTGESRAAAYPIELRGDAASGIELDWEPLLRSVLADVRAGRTPECVAWRFHAALAEGVVRVAEQVGIRRVLLTGGCFQNELLLVQCVSRLRARGFEPYWHHALPSNDAALALGQVSVLARWAEAAVSRPLPLLGSTGPSGAAVPGGDESGKAGRLAVGGPALRLETRACV